MRVKFPCGDITLEGEWHFPEGRGPFPCVVVCHPHPLYGGDMQSDVIVAICEALSQRSVAAFRFNFRGVGRSQGDYGEGIGEQEDVRAALDFVVSSPNIDRAKIGLAGYSFGAKVALPVAFQDERVNLLALVSPPLSDSDCEQLIKYQKPKLVIVGQADNVASLGGLEPYIEDISNPEQFQVIAGADHFWMGYEEELAQRVSHFFAAGFS